MGKLSSKRIGKRAAIVVLALSLSVAAMMVPATALAFDDSYAEEVAANEGTGDVNATIESIDTDENGILIRSVDGRTADVEVTGGVTAGSRGTDVSAAGAGSTSKLEIGGDVKADDYGAFAEAKDGGETVINIKGSVNAGPASQIPIGVDVRSTGKDSEAIVEVGGYVTAGYYGVTATVREGGTAVVKTGNVAVDADEGFSYGAAVYAYGGQMTVEVGDVISPSGTRVYTRFGSEAIFKAGNVTSSDENSYIGFTTMSGYVKASLGNVESAGRGIELNNKNYEPKGEVLLSTGTIDAVKTSVSIDNQGGRAFVAVDGDAMSKSADPEMAGLYFKDSGNESQSTVLVTEVLSGPNGVKLSDFEGTDPSRLDLTVWKIEATGADGKVIAGDDAQGTFAKAVSYIVKVEQPAAGARITVTKADGSPLDRKFGNDVQITAQAEDGSLDFDEALAAIVGEGGYEVAYQDDKVLVKIDIEEGYKLLGAYNGKGEKIELLKDEDGNYYVVVPEGGGIYLSASLEKDPAPQPVAPASKPVSPEAKAASAMPQTGDADPVAILLVALVSSAGVLTLSRRRLQGR